VVFISIIHVFVSMRRLVFNCLFFYLLLLLYCFLFNCIVWLYVKVWSVVNDPYVEYTVLEDPEDFEQ
jgi:hypothetical protein